LQFDDSTIASERNGQQLTAKMHKVECMMLGPDSDFNESLTCNDILQYMHANPSSPPALILLALEKLCYSRSLAHGIFDSAHSRDLTKLNENWIEVLAATMSNHSSNEMVQLAALRTIWSIVAHDSGYASEITLVCRILVNTMETHRHAKRIQQCGSGLAACLASNHASLMLSVHSGAVVERMGEALYFNSPSALNALFKLLMASRQSNASSDHLIETIGRCTNRECRGGGILTNAMDTILGVMSDCPKHTGVQIWACWLLWVLFSHESRLNSCASRDLLSTLISNILRHLEATTTSPRTSLAVHESAICLLSSISCCSDDLLAGKDEVFSRVVAGIMLAQPKSRTIAMYGCNCISNTLFIQDDTASVLLGAMRDFEDEAVADIAINSILLLTKKGFQAILTLLENDRLVDSIVDCMMKHPNSSSVQIAACDILSSIALDTIFMMNICSHGGASRIISSLYNLSEDSLVVGNALMALSNIIGVCDPAILQESKAPERILCAMEANQMDLCIQIQGATALWNLGSPHNNLKNEIIEFGGISTITKAMKFFIASKEMQEKGIIALWTLSSLVPLEPSAISRAIEAVADAIAAHLLSAGICKHGLGALSTLASSKYVIEDVDTVIDLIFSCMWMHASSATVQQGALSALSKISIDPPTNQVFQITSNDLDVLVNTMRTHLDDKCIQENSIVLIRSLAFCPVNVKIMGQNPFLMGLIKSSMSNFQGSLRVNVEVLLRLLPSDNQ